MSIVIYRLRLDVGRTGAQGQILLKQGDINSRELRAFLYHDGSPIALTDGATVVLRALKPDETMIYSDCTISGNVISYTFTEQFAAAPGIVECELDVYDGAQALYTPRFDIYVEPLVYEGDDIISSNEFGILVDALNRVEELEGTITESEAAREEAEVSRENAEMVREETEIARRGAEAAREAFVYGLDAEAETLSPGASAYADIQRTEESARILIGVPRGLTGAGLALLGHFDTVADLQATHPTGNPGDMYSVGTETPHDTYQWNEATGAWVNEGPIGGGSGTVKSVNAVDPDEDGNITIDASDIYLDKADVESPNLAATLTPTDPGQLLAAVDDGAGGLKAQFVNAETVIPQRESVFINRRFQVWQDGESFSVPTRRYTADMWYVQRGGAVGTVDVVKTASGIRIANNANGNVYFQQYPFGGDVVRLNASMGSNITVGCKCVSVSGDARIRLAIRVGEFYEIPVDTPVFSGINIETTTLSPSWVADHAFADIELAPSASIELEWMDCVLGDALAPPPYLKFDDDFAQCQRYYQKSIQYGFSPGTGTSSARPCNAWCQQITGNWHMCGNTVLNPEMARTPTVTLYSASGQPGYVSGWPAPRGDYPAIISEKHTGIAAVNLNVTRDTYQLPFFVFDWTADCRP